MSCFPWCRNLVTMLVFLTNFFIAIKANSLATPVVEEAAVSAVEEVDPLSELSARRDELVEMAGYGEGKLSTVLVTGSVLCEACLRSDSQLHAWPLSGAKVAVNCHANDKESKSSRIHGVTDENGDYFIDLPSELHAIPDLNKKCSVNLVRMPRNSHCRPAHIRKRKTVRLSSVGNGIRTYEAGTMRLLHSASEPPEACMKKPSGPRESYPN
ncbi:uncharacterized protein LOC115691468 [Syzygium oleosum]|uniref:uncharacterized protein LOC115691468 n=1 Tax=Syzygium oleosum TaxID=219896 RepID=UPI0024BB4791|nr:uncharacterized protein LOC115691468 [Syzygium oleosum]